MKITLYGRPYNRTDRVQWMLEELDLTYEYVKLDVFNFEHRQAEYKTRYGLTRLPFIELDGKVMFESGAIMLFLAGHFRDHINLLPEPYEESYKGVLQWLFFAISTLESSDENLQSNADPAPSAPLVDTLNFLETEVQKHEFIAAGRFTIADIALVNGLKWFRRDALLPFPAVEKYFSKHTSRPSFQKIVAQSEYPKRGRRP
jgi:glutathione S-transferase